MDRMYNFDTAGSRSIESPRRHRNGNSSGGGGGSRREYRRYSRSRSRSRNRSREREYRRRSRSRERGPHYRRGGSAEKDLYRDIIHDDYQEENYHNHRGGNGGGGGGVVLGGPGGRKMDDDFQEERERFWHERAREKGRDYDREYRERDNERDRDRRDYRPNRHGGKRYNSNERDRDDHSDESEDSYQNYSNKSPSNTIIAFGLQPHITEADLLSSLIQYGLAATSIRLIRKRRSGASRGFAFVEFNTVEEAVRWMEITQSMLVLPDQSRVTLQYSHSQVSTLQPNAQTDWYCGKCGIFNFKRRDSCFKCYASREESVKGGEGCDEISNILTKKIMLRNLDVLTNEEGVLTAMQQHVPDLAKRISKILVSRDQLMQTSRGICYLHFDSLVDSMNVHNALSGLEPVLKIDNREVIITYCIDHENREILAKSSKKVSSDTPVAPTIAVGPLTAAEMAAATAAGATGVPTPIGAQHTLADVPRLAEYSAAMYAQTPEEQEYFLKYYTEYYVGEITKGQYNNLPSASQLISETSANSAAAVALSAIQRKQKKMSHIETTATQAAAAAAAAAAAVKAALAAAQTVVTPKGNDGKTYPTPDVSLYQYDETSGYYYDPATGLYYDAHSQYYYNNETGAYLYWDQRKSNYVLATPAAAAATVQDALKAEAAEEASLKTATAAADDDNKKEGKREGRPDKVKVAKKIVKDMEKWAKQLNQKKDYTVVATPQPLLPFKGEELVASKAGYSAASSGYADVGFSILEKKERAKLTDYITPAPIANKLVSAYGSDSDDEHVAGASKSNADAAQSGGETSEKDYVDFQKLTCLLCKRAFQSLEILTKHLKMSALHKENLQKFNLSRSSNTDSDGQGSSLSYRDRAKERRLKYGECDPPPPNRSRERFEKEIKNLTTARKNDTPALPIGSNNVGNRLLQKMGWSEGQGLGRKNQGRTNIIEADSRSSTAGLGTRATGIGPGDDYKSYIKKMMKARYESV